MTYCCANLSEESQEALNQVLTSLDLPKRDEFHITVIYSSIKIHDTSILNTTSPRKINFLGTEIWKTQDGDCLVLLIQDEFLKRLHNSLKRDGAVHSYPTFKPHITLAYNPDNFDNNDLKILAQECRKLNLYYDEIKIEDINKEEN
jgi:2'-5' RNA ligase